MIFFALIVTGFDAKTKEPATKPIVSQLQGGTIMSRICTCLLVIAMLNLTACARVKAWERGNLARPEMAFTQDSLERKIQDHIDHSKEGSSSVVAGSGGGCGCN